MRTNLAVLGDVVVLMLQQRHLRLTLAIGLAEELVALGLGVAAPFLLARTIVRLGKDGTVDQLVLIAAFVLAWLAPSLIAALKAPKTARLTDHLYREISGRTLQRQLPGLAQSADTSSGRLAGVLERLPLSLQLVLDGLIWRAAPLIAQLVFSVTALAVTLPLRYAGLLGLTLAVYLLLSTLSARRVDREVQDFNRTASTLSARLNDVVRNADRIVCNGAISAEVDGLARVTRSRGQSQIDLARSLLGAVTLQTAALGLGLTVILGVASLDVSARRLQIADFVLLQALALRLTAPLGGLVLTVRQAAVSLANIGEALALGRIETVVSGGSPPRREAGPGLRLERVSYAHSKAAGVFDISLTLEPDRLVALVGANGSGKSTLARLMAGVLRPQAGALWIDGEPLEAIEANRRPRQVLYVPQFISLFNRSLQDNGVYPPAAQSTAALAGRLEQWAFNAGGGPVDLSPEVGEQGRRLSGGQIQKLELARLCAIETPVLILDESTSALDGPSEAEILRTLRARCTGRLLILVTHRLGLVESADQVLFMMQGRLAGVGSHKTLLAHADYSGLWSSV